MKKYLSGIFAVMIALSAASISFADDKVKVELFNDRGIRVGESMVEKDHLDAFTQEQKNKGITVKAMLQTETTTGKAMEAEGEAGK